MFGSWQVFIHDPLYKWALTPLGAQQRQKDYIGDSSPEGAGAQPSAAGLAVDAVSSTDNTLANADAERALLRLKQKLAGLEGGASRTSAFLCIICDAVKKRIEEKSTLLGIIMGACLKRQPGNGGQRKASACC